MQGFIDLFLLTSLGSVLGLIGGVALLYTKRLSKILEHYSIPFAAGVLITVSLLGLLPEAVEDGGQNAFLVVFITFFAAYLFEHIFFGIHHHDDGHNHNNYRSSSLLVVIGDTIHNLIDGIAIGASYVVDPSLGMITALSTFLHEVPHEVGDFGILLKSGWKKKNIILVNLVSAMVTFVGAFGVYWFAAGEEIHGTLLAISGGIFLYLGASDFLPHINEHGKKNRMQVLIPLALGCLLIILTIYASPHTH